MLAHLKSILSHIPCFRIEKTMSFDSVVGDIDAALTDWVESEDDSKVFFGELVESGVFRHSHFIPYLTLNGT